MSDIHFIAIDGVEHSLTHCDLEAHCEPIFDPIRSEETGFMCHNPGPMTIDFCVYLPVRLSVVAKDRCELRVTFDEYAYIGEFVCKQHKEIGSLHRYKFHRDGRMTQVTL